MSPQVNIHDPHHTAIDRKHYWGLTKELVSNVTGVVASRWQANGGSDFAAGAVVYLSS